MQKYKDRARRAGFLDVNLDSAHDGTVDRNVDRLEFGEVSRHSAIADSLGATLQIRVSGLRYESSGKVCDNRLAFVFSIIIMFMIYLRHNQLVLRPLIACERNLLIRNQAWIHWKLIE